MTGHPIDERVTLGSAWLDEHAPGWLDKVDLDILNEASDYECVLGQVFHDPDLAPATCGQDIGIQLMDGLNEAEERGFLAPEPGPVNAQDAALTRAWVKRIKQLRAERGAA